MRPRRRRSPIRRGAVAILVAVSLIVIFGFGALAIDLGRLQTAAAELQRAADAAALAAAQDLMLPAGQSPAEAAIASAGEFAERNAVLRVSAGLDAPNDVEFGRARVDAAGGKVAFEPVGDVRDANVVRVTLRRSRGSAGGPIAYRLAHVLGRDFGELERRAAAMVVPRDIAVVIDLSGSMNDDSELRHAWSYDGVHGRQDAVRINLRDVWAALDGPRPDYPYRFGEYASDAGPAVGVMSAWGSAIEPQEYDARSDAGLWHIPYRDRCTEPAARASLLARGYSESEVATLMSSASDAGEWRRRAAVIVGLARWRPSGPNDDTVNELTWAAYPAFRRDWSWNDYSDYVADGRSEMARANPDLRYRFGPKTFVNFLLESKLLNSQTALYQTPEQPLQAVKDAVQAMIEATGAVDAMSLEVFAQTARHEVDLTTNRQAVADRLYDMQAGHYDMVTNIGGGIDVAIDELTGPRARGNARKVIVFMSDGVPNVDSRGRYVGDGGSGAFDYALQEAQRAADEGIRVYTISVGDNLDRSLMRRIAEIGGGEEFHAAGDPEEYAERLREIFRTIGGRREIALIE